MRLFASLQKWLPDNPIDHEIVSPRTIGEFLQEKEVPEDVVAIILCNGNRADLTRPLADGDSLEIFPLLGGG